MERIMMPTKQANIRTLMMVRRERALRMKVMDSSLGCLPAVQVHPHGTRRAMTPSHAARSGGRQHKETGFEIRLWRAGGDVPRDARRGVLTEADRSHAVSGVLSMACSGSVR